MSALNCCCNIVWLILFGWELCLIWCFYGVIYCITICGIPFGCQAFKIGCYVLWPFGKKIVDSDDGPACGCWSCLCNVIWVIFGGLVLGIFTAVASLIFFVSIIGIPIGCQLCRLALISFAPFGKKIVDENEVAPSNGGQGQAPTTQNTVQIYQGENPPTSS